MTGHRNLAGVLLWVFMTGMQGVWGQFVQSCDYSYYDDFGTSRAREDSYSHSVFWPEGAYPPGEPYLYFSRQFGKPPQGLMFVGYQGWPAHLAYRFPVASLGDRWFGGTLDFDVRLPTGARALDPDNQEGYLTCSLSGDGYNWSIPTVVGQGHHSIELESSQGTCYVMFLGTMAVLDNVRVCLNTKGRVIKVPTGPYPTIQAGINAAIHPEDVVEVAPGVYSGPGNRNIRLHGKPIMVYGAAGPEVTIIDCGGQTSPQSPSRRGFYIHEGEGPETIIKGFTIINGTAPGVCVAMDSQSPWVTDAGHPIGGGIYCEYSSPRIVDCVIRHCRAEMGGGIGCVGGSPEIVDCVIEECMVGALGGCINGGAGAGFGVIRGGKPALVHCNIQNNTAHANSRGGGVFSLYSSVKMVHCRISGNSAEDDMLDGGGVYFGGNGSSRLTMWNSIIAENRCDMRGGGLYAERDVNWTLDGDMSVPEVEINLCTVARNRIGNNGGTAPAGGIFARQVDIRIRNSIAWFNDGQEVKLESPGSNSPVAFSNIEGGYPGMGNIADDPLFASLTTGDYHLRSLYGRYAGSGGATEGDPNWVADPVHSPSIDAGDPKEGYYFEPIPNGRRVNMGAYGNTLEASKGIGHLVYHVDGRYGDDGHSGLNREQAFQTIQQGIERARDDDVVLVWPGVYEEGIFYDGKAITVQSAADAAVIKPRQTVLDEVGVDFSRGEGRRSVLKNVVITGCDIGIRVVSGTPTISNVTVVNCESGVEASNGAEPKISHSIFWFNTQGDLLGTSAEYSCIETLSDLTGMGNISVYPKFVDPEQDDYHLVSERGRFMPMRDPNEADGTVPAGNYQDEGLWVLDYETSPCIDRGNPRIAPRKERMPNGGRLNMGAYGGTAYASMSEWPLRADFDYNGVVDLRDFRVVSESWLGGFNEWPRVTITRPVNGETTTAGLDFFLVEANAVDPDGQIVKVDFYLDGVLMHEDMDGTDGWQWITSSPDEGGEHTFTAVATDNDGAEGTSPPVRVFVNTAGDMGIQHNN